MCCAVLLQDLDGVLLVIDPQHPEQEQELEQFYLRFAQPHNLTMKQCCVLAVSHGAGDSSDSWPGVGATLTVDSLVDGPGGCMHPNLPHQGVPCISLLVTAYCVALHEKHELPVPVCCQYSLGCSLVELGLHCRCFPQRVAVTRGWFCWASSLGRASLSAVVTHVPGVVQL